MSSLAYLALISDALRAALKRTAPWLRPPAAPSRNFRRPANTHEPAVAPGMDRPVSSALRLTAQRGPAPTAAPPRPVRVLRVIEQGQTSAQSGRLRITGRMADVCAELDRLAAGEARLQT